MFSVVLQAYFSTRSSRSLEAGTWPQFSTPLSPEPIVNGRWPLAGGASFRSTSVCPFEQGRTRRGRIKTLERAMCYLQSLSLKAWALLIRPTPQANSLSTSPARARRRGRPAALGM